MKKLVKVLLALVVCLLLAAGAGAAVVTSKFDGALTKQWAVAADDVVVPTDDASLTEGKRLLVARGCADCHAADLGGRYFFEDKALGRFYSSDLSPSGRVGQWSDAVLARAIRHGIDADGHALRFMPSHEFSHISNRDMGMLIRAMRAVPPTNRPAEPWQINFIAKAITVAGLFPLIPAEIIDHANVKPTDIVPAPSVEFGKYLVPGCFGCHGQNLSGGPIPGAGPEVPVPKNLTPDMATGLGRWTPEQFVTLMRTGKRPDGSQTDPFMPWKVYGAMTDDELNGLYAYLHSLPPAPFGGR